MTEETSNSVYENLMKLYLSNLDSQNTTQDSEICIKFKYNNEKRQFQLKRPLTYQFLINLINTKFDANLIPYYTINNGDFLCPLENQNDLDCALLIYDKENSSKKNSKVNILLSKKNQSDQENRNTTSSPSSKPQSTLTTTKSDPKISYSPPSGLFKAQTSLKYDKLHMNKFLNNSNDSYSNGANKTNFDYLNNDILNTNHSNDENDNGGFFIPEEDEELYRETKYSESDGASYLESYLSHNDQWPNNINYEDESFHQDYRKDKKLANHAFTNRRSGFNNNNNLSNKFSNHDNIESQDTPFNSIPKISLNTTNNTSNRPLLNKFQSLTANTKTSNSISNHILKTNSKSYPSSESSSGLGDSPNTPQPPKNWKLGKVIGTGGFGIVNLCSDSDTGRFLAVKHAILNPLDQNLNKSIKMLQLEIEMLKTLSHERIVQYYGTIMENNELFIFVEYMPGGSLKDKIDQFGLLSEVVVKKYTKQILEGLSYLHSHNVIHRDVKGSNILCDTNGNIKLCDFGASKFMQEIATTNFKSKQCDTYIGTCHYMSPEIIKGEKYGRKIDIWSLGCTVVEMFTGKPPWHNLQHLQLIYRFYLNESPQYTLPNEVGSNARNFLSSALNLDYQTRPSAETLLLHEFLS